MKSVKSETRNASWVARHLNISPQTVVRLVEEGKLRGFKWRERGPWHILLDSVHELERKALEQAGIEDGGKR